MYNRSENPFAELISQQDLKARIAELGAQITKDYADRGDNTVLLGVLKGSILFLSDLARQVHLPVELDFIGISSYGNEQESSGVVKITADVTRSIKGKHVIVVEDIVDTGLTAKYLLENLHTRQPASIALCSLLHKPDRTIEPVKIDYLGFPIPDKFVVGYGLDFAQKYRNIDFIGVVENS